MQAAASPRRRLKEKVSEIVRSNGHIITIKIGVAGYNILKDRTHDRIALFSRLKLAKTPLTNSVDIYMVR